MPFSYRFFILYGCRNFYEIGNITAYPAEADSVDMKQNCLLCKHPTITIGAINFQNDDLLKVKLVKKGKGVAILFFIKNGKVHKVKSQIVGKDKVYAVGVFGDIYEYHSNIKKKWLLLISCKNDIVHNVWNKKEAGECPFYKNSKYNGAGI